ncbi:MAG TPA: condensation domain-containing protein [Streptosporangiaceae bacterium]|jgi:uncharacterized protein YbdZ (MbtH family)
MSSPFEEPAGSYLVLVNEEGQHSLWPAFGPLADGWTVVHGPARRDECVDYITGHWTDLRPRSLVSRLAGELPLSLQQAFLGSMDRGDDEGSFGAKHIIGHAWRLTGRLDEDALRAALRDVVARHEMLRTAISRGEGAQGQRVHPPGPVRLMVRDLPAGGPADRDREAERFFNEIEAGVYPVRELPHLRAVLGRFDDQDGVLVLVVHHVACDAWSMQVIVRDLATRYAVHRGHAMAALPAVRQYGEFAAWQLARAAAPEMAAECAYWRQKLAGARLTNVPTDRPRRPDVPPAYATHRFDIDAELTAATLRCARALRSSPFMVVTAAYMVLLSQLTGVTDVVVPTFSAGRGEEQFHDTVGAFLNFLPLRADFTGCRTFREVAERVRQTCVEAYTHDIPFPVLVEEAPELMSPMADQSRDIVAFEVFQTPSSMTGEVIGEVGYAEIRKRLLSQPVSSDIPDGALWALDVLPDGVIIGSLKFNTVVFDPGTAWYMIDEFRSVLRRCVTSPEASMLLAAGSPTASSAPAGSASAGSLANR